MFYSGLFDLQWWAYPLVALGLTHATIVAVTIYLHRHQTHHALDLHPRASATAFRFWLWVTTGMVTPRWVAAASQAPRPMRNPRRIRTAHKVLGIAPRAFGAALFLYVRESRDRRDG